MSASIWSLILGCFISGGSAGLEQSFYCYDQHSPSTIMTKYRILTVQKGVSLK